MLLEHLRLLDRARVAERDPDHEPVELRLGQRIGALVLGRVLGREDDERAGELVLVAVDGDVALLHALEQAGLGLRRAAVDLVDEDDVGEHRPGVELEARLALVEDVGADDVGRQQVGGALDARVLGVDRARERPRERRLADARVVLDQHVALGEQGDEQVADDGVVDLHRQLDVVPQPLTDLRHASRVQSGNRRHVAMVRVRCARQAGGGRASGGAFRGLASALAPLMRPGRATRGGRPSRADGDPSPHRAKLDRAARTAP